MNVRKIVVGLYQENCYFLVKGNDLIIVDPGSEYTKLNNIIKNNNLNLKAILITHAHFDHIGALKDLIEDYNVPVYYNNVNDEITTDKLINVQEKKYSIDNFNFEVIYTKGHRNDCVTYYFYEDNIMFTGDFLFKESVGRVDLEYADSKQMRESIEKIKKYDNNIIIYPGHGEETTLGYEKENNMFFD